MSLTIYLTLAGNAAGGVDVAISDPMLGGGPAVGSAAGAAVARVRQMAWDLQAAAVLRGATVGVRAQGGVVNPVLLVGLANAVLDREQFGCAVTGEVRDFARLALGLKPVESHLCPDWKDALAVASAQVAVAPDWSAA